ncbi:MAG: DUF3990 domain-containing protein [Lentimicrobiaceae bacterium]|nr:DUF3990 domain-containing protein [Lentimicrobiaceae bacterium]
MRLYHGTNVDIYEIDINKCNPNKDFGQGFYLTDIKEQAISMAKRRVRIDKSGEVVIIEYNFNEEHLSNGSLKVKIFDKPSKEWALFILNNRRNSTLKYQHDYDIVIGPVANDGVVFQLDRYENNMITLDILVEELSYQKLNKQYFFGTEKAISKLIRL